MVRRLMAVLVLAWMMFIVGCGFTNGLARDIEHAANRVKTWTQPAVNKMETTIIASAMDRQTSIMERGQNMQLALRKVPGKR